MSCSSPLSSRHNVVTIVVPPCLDTYNIAAQCRSDYSALYVTLPDGTPWYQIDGVMECVCCQEKTTTFRCFQRMRSVHIPILLGVPVSPVKHIVAVATLSSMNNKNCPGCNKAKKRLRCSKSLLSKTSLDPTLYSTAHFCCDTNLDEHLHCNNPQTRLHKMVVGSVLVTGYVSSLQPLTSPDQAIPYTFSQPPRRNS